MHLSYTSYAIISRHAPRKVPQAQREMERYIRNNFPMLKRKSLATADLIIVFGGDGTLLEAIRSTAGSPGHLLAFNTGHTGFLSSAREEPRFVETLEAALHGRLLHFNIPLIQVIHRSLQGTSTFTAVNDVLIERTMTWMNINAAMIREADTTLIKEIRGSGVYICSPIGSTSPMAINLQAPCIDPALRVLYLKGVNNRRAPATGLIVSASDQRLRLSVMYIETNLGIPVAHRYPPEIYLDGTRVAIASAGDELELSYLPQPAILLRQPDDAHWNRMRSNFT